MSNNNNGKKEPEKEDIIENWGIDEPEDDNNEDWFDDDNWGDEDYVDERAMLLEIENKSLKAENEQLKKQLESERCNICIRNNKNEKLTSGEITANLNWNEKWVKEQAQLLFKKEDVKL